MINNKLADIADFLNEKYIRYNTPEFILSDPIQIPHRFTLKEDIEISGFLSSTIAWGQRKSIIKNADRLVSWMDNSPYDFIKNANENDFEVFSQFVHRTFNGHDCIFFLKSLQNIYKNHNGLEAVFSKQIKAGGSMKDAFIYFRNIFFETEHLSRSEKHIANVNKNSAAKRLNLFVMWMVRQDNSGVHFGLWKDIATSKLFLPLDVHTANVGRKLNLLKRKQNDWKAVEEITSVLRQLDPNDPCKYDFALFGLGVFEKF